MLWAALASVYEREANWPEVEKVLDQSEKALGDGAVQRILRAGYLLHRYGPAAKDRLHQLAENAGKLPDNDRLRLWAALLDFAMQINDTKQIDVLCRRIAEKQPDNAQVRYQQFRIALATGDEAAMRRALDDIRRVAGESYFWLWGKAVLADHEARSQKQKDPAAAWSEALKYLAKARDMRGDWPLIPVTMAQIYDRQGRQNLALKNYLEAIDLGYYEQNMVLRAMQILVQTQQYGEADRRLRRLEAEHVPFSPDVIRLCAEVALNLQDYNRVLDMTRKIAASESKTYREYFWLGKMFDTLGGRAKAEGRSQDAAKLFVDAESALRSAAKLEPKLPASWIMLVQHCFLAGEVAAAEQVIREARQALSAKDAPLALAQCYDVMGMAEPAGKEYAKALEVAPEDLPTIRAAVDFFIRNRKIALAEPMLQKIVDGAVKADEANMLWARRQLALTSASHRDYRGLRKAQHLLELNRDSTGGSIADLQVLARLYASDPSRARRGEAIAIWEDMIQRQQATLADRYSLAQLYLSAGEWTKASGMLRSVVADANRDPHYLVVYIEALLNHHETSDVPGYIERLSQLTSNGFDAIRLKADLLCATKRPQEAFDLLTKYVDRTDVQPKDRSTRVRLAADKLANLSRELAKSDQGLLADKFARQAEILYRSYSEDKLPLAVFLAGLGPDQMKESLKLLEGVIDSSSPDDFAKASDAILKNIAIDKDKGLVKQLDQLVEKAMAKHGRRTALLLVLADSCTRQGRYTDAEAYYREVIKQSPNEAYALNNLAVILAMQGIKLQEAMKFVNQAIDVLGPLGPVLDSRAIVQMASHNLDEALKDVNEALDDRETPVRLFHQAQIYLALGQESSAKTSMFKAVQRGLAKDMLQPVELPSYVKLQQLMK